MTRSIWMVIGVMLVATAALAQERRDEFYYLSEINKASSVMVVEQGIVPKALGKTIAESVSQVITDGQKAGAKRSGDYLEVEKSLIAAGGPDVTRMHSGRSRQDIGATRNRLFQREQVIATFAALNNARATLLDMAAKHANAIVPAYTVGVQAQPISFGHYILAYAEALERNAERMRRAYASVNKSPLGAAALGTSSFPVNRARLAELLGFDGIIENSLDANQISPIDTGFELVSVASAGALTVGTLISDVEAQYRMTTPWLTLEEGELTAPAASCRRSAIPTPCTACASRPARCWGSARLYLIKAHNVPHGLSDYKGSEPANALDRMARMLGGLTAVVKQLNFNAKRALDEVNDDYSTTTELADILQRDADVPFRVGHHFASELVNYGRGNRLRPVEIPYGQARRIYAEAAKHYKLDNAQLPLTEAQFRRSLTAENMIESARVVGGPQASEVARMLAAQRASLKSDREWVEVMRGKLNEAAKQRDAAFAQLKALP